MRLVLFIVASLLALAPPLAAPAQTVPPTERGDRFSAICPAKSYMRSMHEAERRIKTSSLLKRKAR